MARSTPRIRSLAAAAAGALLASLAAGGARHRRVRPGRWRKALGDHCHRRRRETNLENTPLSETAITAQDLLDKRVLGVNDITHLAPSLVFVPFTDAEAYLSIRGNTTVDDSTGTDQGITMYVDDVPRISVADLDPDLFDVARVEVLNGPQGTLFGRNTIAGVVAIYTNDPVFSRQGEVEGSAGNEGIWNARLMLNAPLVADKLALRLALTADRDDGYIKNISTGQTLGEREVFSGRLKLLWLPSPNLRALTEFDYLTRGGTSGQSLVGNFPPDLYPAITLDPLDTAQGIPGKTRQNAWTISERIDWTTPAGRGELDHSLAPARRGQFDRRCPGPERSGPRLLSRTRPAVQRGAAPDHPG